MIKKSIILMSICALSLAIASTVKAGKFNQDDLGEMDNLTISKSPQTILTMPQPDKPNKTKTEKRKNEEKERMIKAIKALLIKKQLVF
jgi:hypothetical protein